MLHMRSGQTVRWAWLAAFAVLACRPVEVASAVPDAEPHAAPGVQPDVDEAVAPRALGPLQVAITVDDLPAHGPSVEGLGPLEIHDRLLAAFAAHEVPQVYGFVNAETLERRPELRRALQTWVAAGYPLGNHTFTHPDLRTLSLAAYYQDIAANEALLDELALGGERTPTFRYPFLLEGMSREDTVAIREHLARRGYRVAPVTVDFYDWAFNGPFARCTEIGDADAPEALRTTFIAHAIEMLRWSDAAARQLYGRRIPHVLLMHVGAFDAEMIEPLLAAMEAEDVQWVSLDAALADPVYGETYVKDGRNQGTLLDQKIDAEGGEHPPRHVHPRALLEALCPTP